MKILVASNMYPGRDPECDYKGIFVKEQVDCLNALNDYSVDVHFIDGHKGNLSYIVGSFILLYKAIFGGYDLIHCHYGLSAMFTLLIPFKKWGKVILTLHGGDILAKQGKKFQVLLTKKILKKVGFVITLNDEMNNIVSEITKKYKTQVCGADADLFNSNYCKKEQTVFLFPGNPKREVKNFSFFSDVVQAYNESGKSSKVVILDELTRKQMSQVMKEGSLLLMTSHSEGSPQVIKEALLSDLPVLSSKVGDVSQVVGITPGTLIYDSTSSPKFVAELIDPLLDSAFVTKGQRRKRIFDINLDQTSVIKELVIIYKRILA